MGKPTFKRFLAYIIDIIIITLIASAFSKIKFINPNADKLDELQQEYTSYILENPNAAMNSKDETILNMSYDLAKLGIYNSVITLVITFLYFSIFQYYTGGKTAGKKLLGIQVISTDGGELKLSQVVIRSAIVNSIITSTLVCICMVTLSKQNYISISNVIQILDIGIVLLCAGMIIYREDGVGFHDKLAHTKVVRVSDLEDVDDIKEAKIVSEKVNEEVEENKQIEEKIDVKPKRKTTPKKSSKKENK